MPEFSCRVATLSGEVFDRTYTADDETRLRRDLEKQDLMILDLRRRNPAVQQMARAFRVRGTVSAREFLLFNQEFAALMRAGLPILGSLDILLERRKNPTFKQALLDIRDRVRSGEALSDAFAAQGPLFPPLYSSSLASGERSGELGSVLTRFIDYTQRVLTVKSKVVSALIYPAILLTLSSGLIVLMVFYIVPKFSTFLTTLGSEPPLITKLIVGLALACSAHWQLFLGGFIAAVGSWIAWQRTEAGKYSTDRLKLRLPLVGQVAENYAENRFTRTLGVLAGGGIPLVTALELAARAVGNRVYERALLQVMERVREGHSLWESLAETRLVSDITIQMVKVGESTGALEEMLTHASEFTDHEISTRLTRLVSLIEPLMLVFMAVVVATMLLAIYMPMFSMVGKGAV